MMNVLFALLFASSAAFAADSPATPALGPTGIANIAIGMNKASYISALGINPVNCNTSKNGRGEPLQYDMKYLTTDAKTLCSRLITFEGLAAAETIHVGGISYDVIETPYKASKQVHSLGISSKAIFISDRLIRVEIYSPNVTIETLEAKYGPARLIDNTKIEICKNKMGSEFKNRIGNIDAVWFNGEVGAILRVTQVPPRGTCTDGGEMRYYIIEQRKQVELIEAAINNYLQDLKKATAKESPF